MNSIPENSLQPENISQPDSDAPLSQPVSPPKRRELTPEERALLPDFDDKPRIGRQKFASATLLSEPAAPDPTAAPDERRDILGGAVGGCVGNVVLGFVLLAFERAGLTIVGPGALAIVLGCTLLMLLAREWPRRVMLAGAAFGISLLLSYLLLYLLVRPAFNSFDPSALPGVPPDETGQSVLQVPQNAPQPAS